MIAGKIGVALVDETHFSEDVEIGIGREAVGAECNADAAPKEIPERMWGMTEGGVHLLEAVYFLAFAVVLQRTLRPLVQHDWVAAVSPLFVIGAYWAAADAHLLTQIEALVLFPLYVAIWGVTARPPNRVSTRRLVVTGVAGAAGCPGTAGGAGRVGTTTPGASGISSTSVTPVTQ